MGVFGRWGAGALASIALAAGGALVYAASMSGAIFTTDAGGSVNINIYGDKEDVYVNGGPAHEGAAGLPDGYYYIQVTEPNGTLLGTSVGCADETPIHVTNGEFDEVYRLWDIVCKASDASQGYDDTGNNGGEYKVWVSTVSTFDNDESKTDNFKVEDDGDGGGGGGDPESATVHVKKFYDANANGTWDSGEVAIEGWKVDLEGPDGYTDTVYTSWTSVVAVGDWTFTEATPLETDWMHTTDTAVSLTLADGDEETVTFGNLCLGAGGGHTLGFWSNKNGQALIGSDDRAALGTMNLVDDGGSAFDPASNGAIKVWLLNGTAVNMAYMLSVQLAAMKLNVLNGFVDGDALVYAPDCGNTGVGNDFITIADLIDAADGALGSDGYTPSGDANRASQECLKNALDEANNNRSFVQASPCPFSFE